MPSSAAGSATHHVAVLISGATAGEALISINGMVRRGLGRHVFAVLSEQFVDFATFLCLDPADGTGASNHTSSILGMLPLHAAAAQIVVEERHASQIGRLVACYHFANRWAERTHLRKFSHFLRTRPDAVWHADLPPLRSWPLDAVALRARVLIGHVRISSDAMAWHGCGLRDGSLAPLCHGPGKGLAALAQSADASCVVLDDQVVLVPACVAPRFFLTLLTGGRAPSPSNWSAGLATRPKLACQDAATASLSPHAAARGNTSLPYTMPYTLDETIRLDDDWLRTSWTRRGSGEAWRACPSDCWPWVDIYEGAFTVALARGGVAVAISPLRVRLLSQVHSTVPFPTEERTFACNETDHVTARSALRAAEDRALHLQQKQVF